jgi:diguanylate cyclase
MAEGACWLAATGPAVGELNVSERNDNGRAEALAHDALAWMAERRVPPTARNYEVILAYVGGENAELKTTIDGLSSRDCRFDPSVMASLHDQYFRIQRESTELTELSGKISSELGSLVKLLNTAGRDQSAYGTALSKASGELDQPNLSENRIKNLINHVVQATHAMEIRSKTLENEVKASSQEVAQLRLHLESVRRESLTDTLTGVPNRKAFDTELKRAMEQSAETGEAMSLLMCDIDHFKTFNDTWGHQTGDQVLRLVANCISENVKGRDTAARFGGEEFAVVLPQTELADAVRLANQIRSKVESKKLVKKSNGDILGVITISIGVAQYDMKEGAEGLIQRADACLYAAKRAGRNRVMCRQDAGAPKKASAA